MAAQRRRLPARRSIAVKDCLELLLGIVESGRCLRLKNSFGGCIDRFSRAADVFH